MKKNKSILLIGDSQLLPRYIGSEFTKYHETFNFRLKKKFSKIDFLEIIIGGGNLSKLISQVAPYYGRSKPNLVIIFGSNQDAKIRGISFFEEKILNLFPYGFLFSKYLINNEYLKKLRKINSTNEQIFTKQVKFITNLFIDSKIIYVGMYAGKKYILKNKYFLRNMIHFNKIFVKNLKKDDIFLDIQNDLIKTNCFMKDSLHINKIGHKFLLKVLAKKISKILS